ncbi:MAG TPA: hypothetical protein VMT03_26880 [Polyangia bacterium]|nr:hypothetical protein [Polyangia bacterium]
MDDPGRQRPKRPFDTRISLTPNPGGLEIVIPPPRVGAARVASFLFLATWLTITWAVTSHTAQSRVFTLPFWAIGIALTGALLLSMIQTTRIAIGVQTTVLERRPFGSRRALATPEIAVRVGRRVQRGGDESTGAQGLLLEYGTKTYTLMLGYSDQEQRWVEAETRAWLARVQPA